MSRTDRDQVLTKNQFGIQKHGKYGHISGYLTHLNYKMGKVIGEGSYSKVRITTRLFPDGSPAYRLACKIINKKKASEDFVTRFLPRELEIVSRIQHPNIIRVYDIVEIDKHVYIFMDWCNKGDLLEYIKEKNQISEHRSRHYFNQLLAAVRYLHRLDIAHRDLKCENVLLTDNDLVQISDFGFARFCRDDQGKRTLSNTYCGSAAYAAPEILQGTSYNPKLYDMWSLGCVLYIMLTGHMPFDESNISQMLKNQIERILTYPSSCGHISNSGKHLIRRLLEPDVTRRANIEQAIVHPWLHVNSLIDMKSIKGGGDVAVEHDQVEKEAKGQRQQTTLRHSSKGQPQHSQMATSMKRRQPDSGQSSPTTATRQIHEETFKASEISKSKFGIGKNEEAPKTSPVKFNSNVNKKKSSKINQF